MTRYDSEGVAMSGYADPGVLVDTRWVAAHLDDPAVRLVEVDINRAAYDAGHIAGAAVWVVYADFLDADRRLKDDPADLATLLARTGIANDTTVVFYSGAAVANMVATFGLWLLTAVGHPDVRLMDGGRKKWLDEGRPLTTDPPRVAPGPVRTLTPDWRYRAHLDLMREAVGAADTTIIDVRHAREYEGELFAPGQVPQAGQRAGRIPGAVHLPYEAALRDDGTFKSAEELRALYAAAGIVPEKRAIPYCTVGGRASLTWFVLSRLLGYPDVLLYQPSWVEWGQRHDTPID